MEESLTYLKEQFELPDVDVRSYSPLVLAYIGDGIYELVIRTAVVGQGNRQANALHKKTSTYVKASAQAAMMEAILEDLTEEELAAHGVNLVIYANQLTRSAFVAMQDTAKDILRCHRAKEVEDRLLPIKDIITLIDKLQ